MGKQYEILGYPTRARVDLLAQCEEERETDVVC